MGKHEIAGIFGTTVVLGTMRYSNRSSVLSPGGRFELLQVLVTKTVVSWQVYQSPGVALNKGGRVNEHTLVTKKIYPGDVPTRSLLTL